MESSIIKKIKSLPPLDDTILKIQQVCNDKNSSLNELVKIVETDPMLTANILKSSNSPLYGFSREIKNISHAISLFGMATIRGFALSSAIKQNLKIDLSPYGISNQQFLTISTQQSALMFNWYSKINKSLLDILIPASFLMEVGKIIISHEITELGKKEEFFLQVKSLKTPLELSNIEKEFVGFSNEEITAKIFETWNLELELVESIRYCNDPQNAPEHIKAYSTALLAIKTCINIFGAFTNDSIAATLSLLAQNELDQEIFLAAIEKVNQ
ncbi:MAG: HDOD domain-containing protein [Sulfurospirillum sp.]|nr:HDOD domain-containing protein [Sulfurospirillum sp.]